MTPILYIYFQKGYRESNGECGCEGFATAKKKPKQRFDGLTVIKDQDIV